MKKMIHKLHRHLHHKTHLPVLSVFSVLAGLLAVFAVFVFEFISSPSQTNIAHAFLSTPCFPTGGSTPTNTAATLIENSIPTSSSPISGTYSFGATFMFPTYLTQANFPATGTCVELAITPIVSPTTVQKYYSWMSDVGTLRSDLRGYTISIPFSTTLLTNTSPTVSTDGYMFDVSVFGNAMIYTNTTSTSVFDVQNTTGSEEQYRITSPASNQTFQAAFTINVYKPTSAVVPSIIWARVDSTTATPMLPWNNTLPTGSPSGSTYVFSIPYLGVGQYAFRACPSGMTSSQLYQADPAPRCSTTVAVTFSTTSTTTNTNSGGSTTNSNTNTATTVNTNTSTPTTSGSVYPPTISTPTSGAALNELSTITGYAEPGAKVRVELLRYDAPLSGTVSTYTLVKSTEVITPTSSGIFNVAVDPLKPSAYRITAATYKSGTWSQSSQTDFTVKPVSVSITNKSTTPLADEVTFEAVANRSDIGTVTFYRAPATTTATSPDILIGSANRVVGSYAKWSLTFNSKGHPNGTYRFFAQAQVAGTTTHSNSLSLAIQNASGTTTTLPSSSNTGTSTNSTSPETTSTNTNGGGTTNSSVTTPSPNDQQNGETPTATESTVAIDLRNNPAADPRKSGELVPESLSVQTITNIQSNTNLPTGLKLSGVGPPNSIVTIYIFSTPIVITTTTDAAGNWTYTLDRPLDNGSHEVYVTVTDETGSVEQKSNPLSFFVAEARAVTPQDYRRFQQQQSRMYETYTTYYLLIAGLLVGLAVVLFLYFRLRNRHHRIIAKIG